MSDPAGPSRQDNDEWDEKVYSVEAPGPGFKTKDFFLGKFPLTTPQLGKSNKGIVTLKREAQKAPKGRPGGAAAAPPAPKMLLDDCKHVFQGLPEGGMSGDMASRYFVLKKKDNDSFVALPLSAWYSFKPKSTAPERSLEEVEAIMKAKKNAYKQQIESSQMTKKLAEKTGEIKNDDEKESKAEMSRLGVVQADRLKHFGDAEEDSDDDLGLSGPAAKKGAKKGSKARVKTEPADDVLTDDEDHAAAAGADAPPDVDAELDEEEALAEGWDFEADIDNDDVGAERGRDDKEKVGTDDEESDEEDRFKQRNYESDDGGLPSEGEEPDGVTERDLYRNVEASMKKASIAIDREFQGVIKEATARGDEDDDEARSGDDSSEVSDSDDDMPTHIARPASGGSKRKQSLDKAGAPSDGATAPAAKRVRVDAAPAAQPAASTAGAFNTISEAAIVGLIKSQPKGMMLKQSFINHFGTLMKKEKDKDRKNKLKATFLQLTKALVKPTHPTPGGQVYFVLKKK